MAPDTRLAVIALVAVVVSVGATPVGPAVATTTPPDNGEPMLVQANNTTATATPVPRHENPNSLADADELPQLRGWLGLRMSEVLIDCTSGAQARDWGACETNRSYPDWLSKYVDIARETNTDRDDSAAVAFRNAQTHQQTYNNQTEAFFRAYEQYQEAREAGNERAARQYGREALRLAPKVNATGAQLIDDYARITRYSSGNLTAASETVRELNGNVSELADETKLDLFVATTLSARVDPTEVSYLDPMAIRGRLETANGTALADRQIRLRIRGKTLRTTTNDTGAFDLQYRPTTLPVGPQQVTVRYVPAPDSPYLESNATVSATVVQVDPNVSIEVTPEAAQFDERVTVIGRVSAGNRSPPGIPVRVTLDGQRVNRTRTGDGGRFTTSFVVPAGVPSGEQSVMATVALEGRALAGTNGSTTLSVQPTATDLTVTAAQVGESRRLTVDGRLRTAAGDPVANQQITIRVNNTTVATPRTGQDGRYATTVRVPPSVVPANASNSTYPVRVGGVYAVPATNLDDDGATTVVNLTLPEASDTAIQPFLGGGSIDTLLAQLAAPIDTVLPLVVANLLPEQLLDLPIWLFLLVLGPVLVAVGYLMRRRGLWPDSARFPVQVPRDGIIARLAAVVASLRASARDLALGGQADPIDEDVTPAITRVVDPDPHVPPRTPYQQAVEALDSGDPDAAVVITYAAVRDRLQEELAVPAGTTHWELVTAGSADGLTSAEVEALQTLAEAYEQAAFAPTSLPNGEAQIALDQSQRLLEHAG